MNEGPRALCIVGLSRRYGAVRALDAVDLRFAAGEVHALMGENGAGKSTLIRLIAGLEVPDGGTITLDGAALSLARPGAAEAAGLRFIHQELDVVPALSVAENMHLGHRYPRRMGALVDWRALHRAARRALDRLGLDHIAPGVPMSRLATGDQMLVRIAATLIEGDGAAPWLYVMDEPTAALTGAEAARLFEVTGALVASGAGVVYVSHRMDEVLRLADRVSVLRDGRHVSTRAIADTSQGRIIEEMTGRPLRDLFPARAAAVMGGGDVPAPVPVLSVAGLGAPGIDRIGFDVARGEVLGLAGLTGSGRGTVLRALIGAVPRTAGAIVLDGAPVAPASPAEGWAAGLAYVPRERRAEGLMMLRAVAENVSLPHLARITRRAGFLHRRRERALVAERAAEVRLKAASPAQAVGHLSGGNQQKVLFARAVAGRPRVLLLDEPTRGVDVGAKFDIYRVIRDLARTGMAVVVASSDLPELIGLCDRIAVLHAGRITGVVPTAGLTEGDLLSLCYATPEGMAGGVTGRGARAVPATAGGGRA